MYDHNISVQDSAQIFKHILSLKICHDYHEKHLTRCIYFYTRIFLERKGFIRPPRLIIAPIVPHILNPLSDTNVLNYIFLSFAAIELLTLALNDEPY